MAERARQRTCLRKIGRFLKYDRMIKSNHESSRPADAASMQVDRPCQEWPDGCHIPLSSQEPYKPKQLSLKLDSSVSCGGMGIPGAQAVGDLLKKNSASSWTCWISGVELCQCIRYSSMFSSWESLWLCSLSGFLLGSGLASKE